jgi:hypothetical protein
LPAIAILVLLTISGVAYTDLLLTSDRQIAQKGELKSPFEVGLYCFLVE